LAIRKIVEYPARVLETKAKEVLDFNQDLKTLVKDMIETMEDSKGIGLAANQIDILKRVLVIRIPWSEKDEEKRQDWHDKTWVIINPKILEVSRKKTRYQEGCLSFPGMFDFVERPETVKISAQDEDGKPFELTADGLFAICIQHEIDHLDGIVFFRRMSRLKAARIKKKIEKRIQELQST